MNSNLICLWNLFIKKNKELFFKNIMIMDILKESEMIIKML